MARWKAFHIWYVVAKLAAPIYNIIAVKYFYSFCYLTGRVHSGMTIVKRIGLVETDKNDRPVDDVKIVKGSVKNA